MVPRSGGGDNAGVEITELHESLKDRSSRPRVASRSDFRTKWEGDVSHPAFL